MFIWFDLKKLWNLSLCLYLKGVKNFIILTFVNNSFYNQALYTAKSFKHKKLLIFTQIKKLCLL